MRVFIRFSLRYRRKIRYSMLTKRADKIVRKYISFINVTANITYKAFLSFCLWLWFYIVMIIGISHCILIAHHTRFCYSTDKHSVCIKIHILLYLQGHKCIDVFRQKINPLSERSFFIPSNLSAVRPLWNPKRWKISNGASTERQFTFSTPVCLMMWWE